MDKVWTKSHKAVKSDLGAVIEVETWSTIKNMLENRMKERRIKGSGYRMNRRDSTDYCSKSKQTPTSTGLNQIVGGLTFTQCRKIYDLTE